MAKTLFGFSAANVARLERMLRWFERTSQAPQPANRRRKPRSFGGDAIYFGKPTAAFSGSPATNVIELDPCDLHGTDNGQPNITAYLQPSQANYAMTNSTTIPTSAICPYLRGGDGYYYLLGNPIEIVTDIDVSATVMTKKTRNAWVLTIGEESAVVTIDTFTTECPGV